MEPRKQAMVRRFGRRDAFIAELKNAIEESDRRDVAKLAQDVGVDRVRFYQILNQTTPPPGPEIINRIADLLNLSTDQRRWLQWLGLRDRADPHTRVLLELYEAELLRLWEKDDPREIPLKLGDRLDQVNFVITNKPVYLRHSLLPVHAILHDEGGRMKDSLVDGWSVEIEPVGKNRNGFLDDVVNHIVLLNAGRQCRIGWLKPWGKKYVLLGDDKKPLEISQSRGCGREPTELIIHKKANQRPYVGDIQGFLSDEVIEAIEKEKNRIAEAEQNLKRQNIRGKINVFEGTP